MLVDSWQSAWWEAKINCPQLKTKLMWLQEHLILGVESRFISQISKMSFIDVLHVYKHHQLYL